MATEKRLIDANALKKEIVDFKVNLCPNGTGYFSGLCVAEGMLAVSPTVDAVEVVHGKWEPIQNAYGELEGWIHRNCGREVKAKDNYCPHCGAKMEGDGNGSA